VVSISLLFKKKVFKYVPVKRITMIRADKNKCLRCGGCVAVCPRSALKLTEHGISCVRDKCTNCKICVEFCPVGALKLDDKKAGRDGDDE